MTENIDTLLKESRVYQPSARTKAVAYIQDYDSAYKKSIADPEGFWSDVAKELEWFSPWTKVLEWNYPWAKWFVGATCNMTYNCLDRHVKTWRKNKVAIFWIGENDQERVRRAVKERDLDDRVTVAGFVPDVPAAMAALDIALYVPLESDGMSRVVFEYLLGQAKIVGEALGDPHALAEEDGLKRCRNYVRPVRGTCLKAAQALVTILEEAAASGISRASKQIYAAAMPQCERWMGLTPLATVIRTED